MFTIESKALPEPFRHDDDHIRTEQELNDRLEGLIEICNIFKNENIPIFLTAGTLLGAVRQKDFIPWDWNCSTGVMAELMKGHEIDLLKKLSEKFIVTITVSHTCLRYENNDIEIESLLKTSPYLRFNCYYKNNYFQVENSVLIGNYRTRPIWKTPVFLVQNEIEYAEIRGHKFPILAKPEIVLEWQYGKDWRIPTHKKSRNESVNPEGHITKKDRIEWKNKGWIK
jgi:hypothetical protein